ncbi:MAG: meiotic recombination [Phylliscum demangeonii]|nr:MAG: meiotic recombination [Phylliscum demangeonii]
MPVLTAADTIRILVATDSHVGYNERDPIRGDDSWKSFHEVMCLAKDLDVDMVLLAGDLFHENKPSRKAMYQVMRSLRMNCYGDKPCELEMLSDASELFQGAFNHVNYEDEDINVAIPVFSIHGNHDDPSAEGHLCALDILQVSGLVNYYGRTPESDNIHIKPILLQKGRTKLALYGMSNVRDERLFRTFRDGKVKFFRPDTQQSDWFNLMAVHQNRVAHSDTGYLPENFLPDFLDFVVWGHEHECLIDPHYNQDMSFHVMQPGSSVATSLVPGEAACKQVALLSITGRDFAVEPHRLKTVRPFVMREIILQDEKGMKEMAKKPNNRPEITRYLESVIHAMIDEANADWLAMRGEHDEGDERPLPLIRLRVEYTPPEGGRFDCENPQRFSNRFVGKVANTNDVVQFHRKRTVTRQAKDATELPEQSILDRLAIDNVKVERLVREFLTAQSLVILPQNSFGDAVSQFVEKDDKHAVEMFVNESLSHQIKHLLEIDHGDVDIDKAYEKVLQKAMDEHRLRLEQLFAAGRLRKKRRMLKPRPENWDSDLDGEWADQPGALLRSDPENERADEDDGDGVASRRATPPVTTRGRGRGAKAATGCGRGRASKAKTPAAARGRGRRKAARNDYEEEEEEEDEQEEDIDHEDEDVVVLHDDDDDDDEAPASVPTRGTRGGRGRGAGRGGRRATASTRAPAKAAPKAAPAPAPASRSTRPSTSARTGASAAAGARQTKLNLASFSQAASSAAGDRRPGSVRKPAAVSADEISDDDDDDEDDDDDDGAFEPAPASTGSKYIRSRR